jgi:hypothetical protein
MSHILENLPSFSKQPETNQETAKASWWQLERFVTINLLAPEFYI